MKTMFIGIGGISLQINLPDYSVCLEERYLPFRRSPTSSVIIWHIHPESIPSNFALPQKKSAILKTWEITKRHGRKNFILLWKVGDPSPWKTALMEEDCSRGDIWIERQEQETISFPLSTLDLLLFSHLLLPREGMILHAGAVKINDEAFLFPAASGGGKSTWVDLSNTMPSWSVLGEDKIIIRKSGDDYLIFGTPWNPRPEFQKADSAPLRGIFFLHHSLENQIAKINQFSALQEMLQQAFMPFSERDELDRAVSILEDVIQRVPSYSFGFRPDQTAVVYFSSKNKQL
ncbi:MAG: hypothetical protein U9N73_11380 [Candidatus Auribacterota bacterium]|nr:hypothetical protein [Candidatus Auribacterota bacterium]